jgi:hypothetical protein
MAKFTGKGISKGGSGSLSKGGKMASTPKGNATRYDRGSTATAPGKNPQDRAPNLQGRVYNEFRPDSARGSTMPPPTKDTEEPRMSSRQGKSTSPAMTRGSGKGLSKGRSR